MADCFDRAASGLTYDEVDALLRGQGVDAELREPLRACLERCDFARFVAAADDPQTRQKLLEEARRLIDLLEKQR